MINGRKGGTGEGLNKRDFSPLVVTMFVITTAVTLSPLFWWMVNALSIFICFLSYLILNRQLSRQLGNQR